MTIAQMIQRLARFVGLFVSHGLILGSTARLLILILIIFQFEPD